MNVGQWIRAAASAECHGPSDGPRRGAGGPPAGRMMDAGPDSEVGMWSLELESLARARDTGGMDSDR